MVHHRYRRGGVFLTPHLPLPAVVVFLSEVLTTPPIRGTDTEGVLNKQVVAKLCQQWVSEYLR